MSSEINQFQMTVLQDFFKIQMVRAYGAAWTGEVKSVVERKFTQEDRFKHNYQGAYDVLRNEGVENLNEKKMDITCLTSLILHDFLNECVVGQVRDVFKKHISTIRTDKNKLASHIPNYNDTLNKKILELTAIKNLRSFLTYLQNSDWAYSEKQAFTERYLQQVEEIQNQVFTDVIGNDQEIIEFESTRRNYLIRLSEERAEQAAEYIPLSYKADDGTSMRYDLEQLFSLPQNEDGFVLFSKEAGYGKTWSIQELAGQCADAVLNSEIEQQTTPILIRMGELAVSTEPIVKAVQELFYPDDETVERARRLLTQESVVLFVDGMDEAAQENKNPVHRELTKLLSSAKALRVIGGTRESDRQIYPEALKQYSICALTDMQVEAFIDKLIEDEEQRKNAKYDYFENPKCVFLKNLRCPFFLKCFIDFVKEGESCPESDTDMMNRLIDKIVEREIRAKGFRATIDLVNTYLMKVSELIGNDRRYMPQQEALKRLKEDLVYDNESYASVAQIKDTLIELHLLREVVCGRNPVQLGFWHEMYKSLFSPTATDTSQWDW